MTKILIVDDEKIVRIGLKTMIKWEEYGYELVGSAEDGLAALDMVEALQPDLVITDLKMPKMDGLELIRTLTAKHYRGKIIVLSNYGEYAMVREAMKLGAIDYLLKVTLKTDELQEVLDKARKQLQEDEQDQVKHITLQSAYRQNETKEKNSVLKDLCEGILEGQAAELKVTRYGLKCAERAFYSLYIRIESTSISGKIKDKKLLSFSMRNITGEMLNEWPGAEIIEIAYEQYMLVIPVADPASLTEEKKSHLARNIHKTLELYLNEMLTIVISAEYTGWNQLRLAYQSCMQAAQMMFYYNEAADDRLIDAKIHLFNHKFIKSEHSRFMAEAKKCLDHMDLLALEELFLSISLDAYKNKYDPNQLKKLAVSFLDLIMLRGVEEGVSSDSASLQFYEMLEQAEHVERLNQVFSEALELTGEKLEVQENKVIYRKEIQTAIDYIKEHAHEKITLGQIAKEVSMNDSYLSRLFKMETGKNIVHFLNDIRMEKALELMKDPNLRVKEIAGLVGIDDPFYFNRIFKKYYQVSPTEFRSRMV